MAIRKFQRGQSPTYLCRICEKRTRDTGDNGPSELCGDCFELAGIENYLLDNDAEEMIRSYGDEARAILVRRPELRAKFEEVADALGLK